MGDLNGHEQIRLELRQANEKTVCGLAWGKQIKEPWPQPDYMVVTHRLQSSSHNALRGRSVMSEKKKKEKVESCNKSSTFAPCTERRWWRQYPQKNFAYGTKLYIWWRVCLTFTPCLCTEFGFGLRETFLLSAIGRLLFSAPPPQLQPGWQYESYKVLLISWSWAQVLFSILPPPSGGTWIVIDDQSPCTWLRVCINRD